MTEMRGYKADGMVVEITYTDLGRETDEPMLTSKYVISPRTTGIIDEWYMSINMDLIERNGPDWRAAQDLKKLRDYCGIVRLEVV